ncbi:hypothetical protein P170DRAFT_441735 [Aspergillus steynii IBT 23096]|uniref:Aminoglycoside phosphotransferase domain-containing protein n=1 Tax=Aspergillus steynii IBT 23096 TaxID=1392250 RepID=A0A2I2FRR0_9EURO|nr:uncharacterized protein P170DRAFT_441735 [Aspergillus steynii IBT 23096]PLB43301.1 hypothetical protein P170DRAFT_441735 [Aspergillus steynii IBT 23096]
MSSPLSQSTTARDEEVLSLDLEENDYLYRIKRDNRIVYVSILDGDLIPPDSRTDSFPILSHLRKLPKWDEEWTTLTVRRASPGSTDSIESTADEFPPHGLDLAQLDLSPVVFYNFLDLEFIARVSDRISRVKCHHTGETRILKIARFAHEIPALQREVSIYSVLAASGFPLSPRVVGYVYEGTKSRTVGFLMEEIEGVVPGIQHLDECRKTVGLLHAHGVVHGDLNRYNFLVDGDRARVFDFEVAVVQRDGDVAAAEEEMDSLEARLRDETGVGKRWLVG